MLAPQARCYAALRHSGFPVGNFGNCWTQAPPLAGKKSHTDPKLLTNGRADRAAFALQKIDFSNVRFWRKADIGLTWVEWPVLTQSGHSVRRRIRIGSMSD